MKDEIENYLDMAIILIKEGKIEKAKALLNDLLYQYPDDPRVADEVIKILSFAKQYGGAETDE